MTLSEETRGSMPWVTQASSLQSEEQASAISEQSHPEGIRGVVRS